MLELKEKGKQLFPGRPVLRSHLGEAGRPGVQSFFLYLNHKKARKTGPRVRARGTIILILLLTLFTFDLCAGKNDDDCSSDDSYEYEYATDSDDYDSAESEEDEPLVVEYEKYLAAKKWLGGPEINTPDNLALNKAIWQAQRSALRYRAKYGRKPELDEAIQQLKPFAKQWPVIVAPIVTAFEELRDLEGWHPNYRDLFNNNRYYVDQDLVGKKGQNKAEREMASLLRAIINSDFNERLPSERSNKERKSTYYANLYRRFKDRLEYDPPEMPRGYSVVERMHRSLALLEEAEFLVRTNEGFKNRHGCNPYDGKRAANRKAVKLYAQIFGLDMLIPLGNDVKKFSDNDREVRGFVCDFRNTLGYFLKTFISQPAYAEPCAFYRNIQQFEGLLLRHSSVKSSDLLLIIGQMLDFSYNEWDTGWLGFNPLIIALYERSLERRNQDLSGMSAETLNKLGSYYKSYLSCTVIDSKNGREWKVNHRPDGAYYRHKAYELNRRSLWMYKDIFRALDPKKEARETLEIIYWLSRSMLDLGKKIGPNYYIFELQQYLDYFDRIILLLEGPELRACNGEYRVRWCLGHDQFSEFLRIQQVDCQKEYDKLMDDESYQKKRLEREKQEALFPGLKYVAKF